jgi:predicted transposase YdaD
MDTHDIVQRLKDEGRDEGRHEGRREGRHEARQRDLLTIYRTRFGSVPRKVRAAVERTRDDTALARWIEIFVARSAAEIVAAVAAKKV